MDTRSGVRVERAAATRATLIATARRLFAENGYHATSTTALVDAAGVTRGALYHHFGDKEDLFEVVFREVAYELAHAAGNSVVGLDAKPWLKLQRGLRAFLKILAGNREAQRIVFVDGPAVLGWSKWRELHSEIIFGNLVRLLQDLMRAGIVRQQPAEPLAHLILAALSDAAMSVAHSNNPDSTQARFGEALRTLTSGLRRRE